MHPGATPFVSVTFVADSDAGRLRA
jgi:hypothetical protein